MSYLYVDGETRSREEREGEKEKERDGKLFKTFLTNK